MKYQKSIPFFFPFIFFVANACHSSLNNKVLNDPRFASQRDFETHKIIPPKVICFDNYTFVEGNDTSSSTLGMFYGNKEIFFSKHQDGMFDTIIQANFNNDGVPDFLVKYSFEDGANLLGLLSKNKSSFIEKQIGSTIGPYFCGDLGDTSNYMCPFMVEDINHDGKDEVIINAVKMNGKVFSIACTDTVFVGQ